ncbi:unnamed protein product [Caenorhabditis angaria]|uniref:Uncharacterized protein n=1 Tax=Caenorhabditis angaria TaxID=860376 RepID=A0A9P1N4V8_9PELO|nr:unnamed protein product [Caenorhabditis angaria]
MFDWTLDRVLRCMAHLMHEDDLPQVPMFLVEKYREPSILEKPRMKKLLKLIYDETPKLRERFESVEEFEKDLESIHQVAEVLSINAEDSDVWKRSSFQAVVPSIFLDRRKNEYISKLGIFNLYFDFLVCSATTSLGGSFIEAWLISKFNQQRIIYEVVPYSAWISIRTALMEEIVDDDDFPDFVSRQDFVSLRKYYTDFPNVFDNLMRTGIDKMLNAVPLACQQIYHETLFDIYRLLEVGDRIYNKFSEALKPFSSCSTSIYRIPIFRLFVVVVNNTAHSEKFLFAKELKNALELILKREITEVIVETETDRKNGIVRLITWQNARKIIDSLGVKGSDYTMLPMHAEKTSNIVSVPLVSTYGTHCKPSGDVWKEIIQYLTNTMKLFQCCEKSDLPKILNWINVNFNEIMFPANSWYAVELWKVRAFMNKAEHELRKYKTIRKVCQVPPTTAISYTKNETFEYVTKLMKPMELTVELFEHSYKMHMAKGTQKISMNNIYWIYSSCVENQLYNICENIKTATNNQYIHRNILETFEKIATGEIVVQKPPNMDVKEVSNSQENTIQKKSVEEGEKKEHEAVKPSEKMDEAQFLKKICELENDLRKSREEKNEMEMKLKTEIAENLKISENLEISKKELKQVRKELKCTREISSKNEKEIQKMKEDQENEKKNYEKTMESKNEESIKYFVKLQKSVKNSEVLNLRIKSLEDDLRLAETSKTDIEKRFETDLIQAENLKKNLEIVNQDLKNRLVSLEEKLAEKSTTNIENRLNTELVEIENSKKNLEDINEDLKKQLVSSEEKNGRIEEENRKLREKFVQLEKWFENGAAKMSRISKNQETLRKYENILKIDYRKMIDSMSAKLTELIQKFPANFEFRKAKNEVEFFEENYESYMENIRKEMEKIETNPAGNFEEGEQEIE